MAQTRKMQGKVKQLATDGNGGEDKPFHVIVLGASGGPREDTATGLLVRSTATKWSKGSVVAVDAGTMVSGIIRVLEKTLSKGKTTQGEQTILSSGPFAGLQIPHVTAEANAAYIFRDIISSVLVTHPHLDHVSGLAMNTPVVEFQAGPKTVAALPSTIAALKNHIFNDITWPNLSDEDGGAGLITYQRLVDGGNQRLGRGAAKGYVKACEGLATKCLGVSHGRCKQRYHPETEKHHRAESMVFMPDPITLPSRRVSIDAGSLKCYSPSSQAQQFQPAYSNGKEPSVFATVESSAFFLRDDATSTEIIVFGDIEPDTISLEPRNQQVWEVAAPKIISGSLKAIFIECSYTDAVEDWALFGHLCPRHLIAELKVLAGKVLDCRKTGKSSSASRKRKRASSIAHPGALIPPGYSEPVSPKSLGRQSTSAATLTAAQMSKRGSAPSLGGDMTSSLNRNTRFSAPEFDSLQDGEPTAKLDLRTESIKLSAVDTSDGALGDDERDAGVSPSTQVPPRGRDQDRLLPLRGLSVYIIHVKDTLTDEGSPRDQIVLELTQLAGEAGLGCEFHAPLSGEDVFV
ncbi:3',5'-cyclic-nucleotide phosphodiesterase pde1 [Myotisia sp. PD_48]|nr:3',5'-cyclic-nucleotide phosphodiesterase pde1 [Myotisia sp. PD_48]